MNADAYLPAIVRLLQLARDAAAAGRIATANSLNAAATALGEA